MIDISAGGKSYVLTSAGAFGGDAIRDRGSEEKAAPARSRGRWCRRPFRDSHQPASTGFGLAMEPPTACGRASTRPHGVHASSCRFDHGLSGDAELAEQSLEVR